MSWLLVGGLLVGPVSQTLLKELQVSDGASVGFQNQLLTRGMVILRDKIRFYEGESYSELSVASLAVMWCG